MTIAELQERPATETFRAPDRRATDAFEHTPGICVVATDHAMVWPD
jgi:hypothetical protein